MDKLLKIAGLSAGYRKKAVISDVDLELEKGEIVCLVGPNGSGKSTLLRTVSGQQKSISGSISLNGRNINDYKEIELARIISILMTDRVEPELMTGYDVVVSRRYPYTGRLGILGDEDRRVVDKVMELVNITSLKDKYFSEMSDGQRQRFMLARALCQEPDILIMDEPMTFLDIKYKKELVDIIRKLKNEEGIAMIISLHELETVKSLADRVVCIKDGGVAAAGRPEEILTEEYINELFDIKQ